MKNIYSVSSLAFKMMLNGSSPALASLFCSIGFSFNKGYRLKNRLLNAYLSVNMNGRVALAHDQDSKYLET